MSLRGANDFHVDHSSSIGAYHSCDTSLGNIDCGKVLADIVAGNGCGIIVNCVGKRFGGRTSVFAIVLDTKSEKTVKTRKERE